MGLAELPDEELVERTRNGEVAAFGEIVTRYQEKLLRYGRRFLSVPEDAEDAVQESFLKAYRNIASFRIGERLSPWLYRIAHNSFISLIRSQKREALPFFDPDELFPHPVSNDKTDDRAERILIREQIEKGLQKVKPKYREVIVLRYVEDLSYAEIGEILRVPIGTVSIRLKRALDQLSKIVSPSTHA